MAAVSTPIPDQNSTAVSIRGGIGASASAAYILFGQVSSNPKDNTASKANTAYKAIPAFLRIDSAASASTKFILSGQLCTAACILNSTTV